MRFGAPNGTTPYASLRVVVCMWREGRRRGRLRFRRRRCFCFCSRQNRAGSGRLHSSCSPPERRGDARAAGHESAQASRIARPLSFSLALSLSSSSPRCCRRRRTQRNVPQLPRPAHPVPSRRGRSGHGPRRAIPPAPPRHPALHPTHHRPEPRKHPQMGSFLQP